MGKRNGKVKQQAPGIVHVVPGLDHLCAVHRDELAEAELQAAAKRSDIIDKGLGEVEFISEIAEPCRMDELRRLPGRQLELVAYSAHRRVLCEDKLGKVDGKAVGLVVKDPHHIG